MDMPAPDGASTMKSIIRLLFSAVALMLSAESIHAATIDIFIAASLREVVTELSDRYAADNPPVSFKRNTGSSGALVKQIEIGAPCDVFFSANAEWTDYLKDKKLAHAGTIAVFAFNELVFAGKTGLRVSGLKDLAALKKIAIGSPKSVPAGQYAMEAFKKADIDKKLKGKLVMTMDVRESLMYAIRGEVDGAFVYKTDAVIMGKNVKILFSVPQPLYPRVTYKMALTRAGSGKKEAVDFYRFMLSEQARKVLIKYGFAVR